MVIGVDVDGVLTELFKFIHKEGEEFAKRRNLDIKKNINGYNTKEIYGWSDEDDEVFWNEEFLKYTDEVEMKKDANIILKKLRDEGNKICIITARYNCDKDNELGEISRLHLLRWLNKHQIVYDELCFSPRTESKLFYVIKNDVDIFIDDSVKNLEEVSTRIPVICMNEPYNITYSNANMIRCDNWNEIYSVIKNLKVKK